jgi:hypothetical protein
MTALLAIFTLAELRRRGSLADSGLKVLGRSPFKRFCR